jgi:hypothetical protein
MKTRLDVAHAYLDRCVQAAVDGELTADEAAGAKWWATELQWEIVDRCLQLHGGYGYINEYEIARLWRDARVQRLYGGTTEIMKEIVGRGLGFLQCLLTGEEQRCHQSSATARTGAVVIIPPTRAKPRSTTPARRPRSRSPGRAA